MPKNRTPSQSADDFSTWLQKKLKELNTDPDIIGAYITGILNQDDESPEEKFEALKEILNEINITDLDELVNVILERWELGHPKKETINQITLDVNEQLAKMLEAQSIRTAKVREREYTEEERRIRQQILAQYSQTEVEDGDAFDSEEEAGKAAATAAATCSQTVIERNTNVQDVIALQKEKREQARLESAAKKQKDKEDRERQKQLREEKKDKRKAVKGERRR